MVRKIISIDEEKCTGCGLCAEACHEGAIGMVDGTARLLRDDYCDGLGDCLPACPAGAITMVEREAVAYDQQAVQAKQAAGGCPGSRAAVLSQAEAKEKTPTLTDAAQKEDAIEAGCLKPAAPMASPAEAGAGERAVFSHSGSAHSCRLYGICLWKLP